MKEVHQQVEKRFKKLGKRFNNIPGGFDMEEIHEFRLEIKKLRALLRMISISLPVYQQLVLPADLKSFYNSVGEIRNLQLHRKRIVSICEELNRPLPTSYFDLIRQEENKHREAALRQATLVDISIIEQSMLKHLPGKMKGAWLKKYLNRKKEELRLLLSSGFADENLHSIRKLIKDLLYNDDFIASYAITILPSYLTVPGNSNELAVWLGDFQDLCMALDLLDHRYLDQLCDKAEKSGLLEIKQYLHNEKINLKHRIISVLDGLFVKS